MLHFIVFLISEVMLDLYVDCSNSVVGHMCNVADIFVQGHVPVMWNVCMTVLHVTSFIAVSLCELCQNFVLLTFAVIWVYYVDYSSSEVEHMYSVTWVYVEGHMAIICILYIQEFQFTSLNALGLYETYTLI